MTATDEFKLRMYGAIDTAQPQQYRSDMVMSFYYMARAQIHALMGIVQNTDPSDPIHQLAQDQLDALYGFMTEKQG